MAVLRVGIPSEAIGIAGGLGPSKSHKLRALGAIPRPATGSAAWRNHDAVRQSVISQSAKPC